MFKIGQIIFHISESNIIEKWVIDSVDDVAEIVGVKCLNAEKVPKHTEMDVPFSEIDIIDKNNKGWTGSSWSTELRNLLISNWASSILEIIENTIDFELQQEFSEDFECAKGELVDMLDDLM